MADVLVVGSINQDFLLKVSHRPQPGETVTGAELSLHNGGKGANQAAAASLLGASVAMLGRVGDDDLGGPLAEALQEKGVDTSLVESVEGESTGAAFIALTPDGENAITVAPGANRHVRPEDVDAASETIEDARVLVAQMEVSAETVSRAVEVAEINGTRALVNLAPPMELSDETLGKLDPLVVNEHEAAFLLGDKVEGVDGALSAAPELLSLGPRSVVITLGSNGAVYADGDATGHVSSPEVEVVDTTGAGDAFVGALAVKLTANTSLEDAVSYAVRAGAAAVTKEGAQGALPSPETVEKL
ncbi:MAG: ribokinase [Rubrobacteraceae bacterium]